MTDTMPHDQSTVVRPPLVLVQPDIPHPSAGTTWTVAQFCRLALVILVWFIALAGLRPLTLPDEGRYASVAWEMFSQNAWLTPLIDGMPYFHKPPLYYWLSAGSYAVFGATPWAARLPSALAATLAVVGIYVFLRLATSPMIARRSVVVLATTPLFYGAAQFANLDMLVAAFITLTILAGSWALGLGDLPRPRLAAAATALFAALAVLSKGLIGIALPGLTLLLWAIATGHWRNLGRLLSPVPLLLFAVTAVPWFAVMQYRYPDFLDYFFVYQQFERFASGGFNNAQPVWFYLPILAAGCLPWTVMAVYNAWRLRRSSTLRTGATLGRDSTGAMPPPDNTADIGPTRATRDGITRLAWVWIGVMVVFFSIPNSKLIGYILPALPPLAMLLALKSTQWPGLEAEGSHPWRRWALVALAVCVVMPLMATVFGRPGTAPLAEVLARQGRPTDITVAIETYPFDLNLLAQRSTPLWVVDDWTDPELPKRDNWRKELFDAAAFAAPGVGAQRLLSRQTLDDQLCAAPLGSRVWLWARLRMQTQYPLLQRATLTAQSGENGLWLWEKKAPCDTAATSRPKAKQAERQASITAEAFPASTPVRPAAELAQQTHAANTPPSRWHRRDAIFQPVMPDIVRRMLVTQWALRR